MERIKNAWSRHGWKMFGPVALLNIKHRFKILLSPGKFDAKSSVDNIPGVETNKSVYLSALGYTHEYGAGGNAYEPIDEEKFITVIRSLPIDPSTFCFVDLGSGKGRALFLAAKMGFNKVIGVEFSENLHLLAKKNIEAAANSWPNTDRMEVIHGDARDYAPPDAATVLYLYNPFDAQIMSPVLKTWEKSMSTRVHDVWIVYANPTEAALFKHSPSLEHISSIAGFAVFRRKNLRRTE